MASTCQQGASKGLKSSKAKTKAATDCSTKFAQCKQTCGEFADTYSESDNFETFNSHARACLALSAKAQALNDSSSSSYDFALSGLDCSTNSSESPQSAGGGGDHKNADARSNAAAAAACATNPGSPECLGSQTPGSQAAEGTSGFGDANQNKGALDVGDPGPDIRSPFGTVDDAGSPPATPPKTATIANNSGGSIPGGSGGAKPGGGGLLQTALNAVKSAITDIEKGFLGGGFSNPPAGEKPDQVDAATPLGSGDPARGLASDGGPKKGVDLRRYLPGGDLGPPKPIPSEIRDQFYGPRTDLFERIHLRYEVKCRLGQLYDCQM